MIKKDPQRKRVRRLTVLYSIVAILIFAGAILQFAATPRSDRSPFFIILAVSAITGVVMILILLNSSIRMADKRRVLAMQANSNLLAVQQPIPNAYALGFPTTIELRLKRKLFLLIAAFLIVGVIVIGLLAPTLFPKPVTPTSLLTAIGIAVGIMILILATLYFVLWRRARYIIHITEQGISSTYNMTTTQLNWEAARLFTMNHIKKRGRQTIYELSNDETVVRWMWVPQHASTILLKPTTPYNEYERQMQGLLELVEAKTHLPLYDITPKTRWWM